mmetsp:Transcript_27973/g.65660  ORF Transcript_27973/g.65660 Transcript_27973/m.65660 type:complete len:82 (-) Transcript_27973:8-253(-)
MHPRQWEWDGTNWKILSGTDWSCFARTKQNTPPVSFEALNMRHHCCITENHYNHHRLMLQFYSANKLLFIRIQRVNGTILN